MYCQYCGTKVEDDAIFCFKCGERLKHDVQDNCDMEKNGSVEKDSDSNQTTHDRIEEGAGYAKLENEDSEVKPGVRAKNYHSSKSEESTLDQIKDKAIEYWAKMDIFCRINTVVIGLAAFILVFSILGGKSISIFLSILQIIVAVVAVGIHLGKIKCDKSWMKYLILVIAFIVALFNIRSFSDVNAERVFEKVYVPYGAKECVGELYNSVIEDFEAAGFYNISEDAIKDLTLEDASKDGVIERITINGNDSFESEKGFFASAKIVIYYHTFKEIEAPLDSNLVKEMEAESILHEFENAGFTNIVTEEKYDLDPDVVDAEYENEVLIDRHTSFTSGDVFPLNAEVKIITHRPYEKHTLKLVIDFVSNIIFSKYDVEVSIGDNLESLEHGEDGEFEYRLTPGTYTIKFMKVGSDSVYGTARINFTGDMNVSYKISCHSDNISVEQVYIENLSEIDETEAMVSSSAVDYKYENYVEVEKSLRDAGFTNITTKILYDIVWGWTDEGEVDSVSIDGNSNFKRGDIFSKEANIVITYHMWESDDPNKKEETSDSEVKDSEEGTSDNSEIKESEETESESESKSVFYSTNDYETATKGNTGIFSYKNKSGSYDVYWIINFDEGYVYYFTEGNGEESCDKVKITSGTLNDRVTITWNMDGEKTNWYLHFKYVGSPVTLIVNDHLGMTVEFTTTDLYKALSIRNTKTINEY